MRWFDTLGRDLRHAIRQLRVAPTVTAVALLSLALGIGANTAIFSLVNAMLLKRLPVHEAERLAELNDTVTHPMWEALRERQDAFAAAFAYSTSTFNLARRGAARTARGMMISGNGFDVLGLRPAAGRLIAPADDRRDGGPSGPAAVISYGFWQREYGGGPTIVGQTIDLDSHPFTIVGVAPEGFTGLVVGESFDIAVPINTQAILRGKDHMLDERNAYWLFMVGRLAPGQTMEAAQARLRALQPQIRAATLPTDRAPSELEDYMQEPLTLQAAGGFSMLRRRYTQPLLVLMGIVSLVLLIACANLANLLLARAAARRRELAVRLSLGASRPQLVRQLLIESLVMAFAGSAAGMLIAYAGSRVLVQLISTRANIVFLDLSLDWRVLAFSIAVTLATGLLFGLAPALRSTVVAPADALRAGGRAVGAGAGRLSIGQALVAAQVALSLMLVFAAALFVRSFVGLATQPLGFDAHRVLSVELDVRQLALDRDAQMGLVNRSLERLRGVAGVTGAAAGLVTPVSSNAWMLNVHVDGYQPTSDRDARSFFNAVSPAYLSTLGTPLTAGRDFAASDRPGAPRVAIVNDAFVKKFYGARNPLGTTFKSGTPPRVTEYTVIGVSADTKYRYLREEQSAVVYVPLAQAGAGFFNTTLYVRSDLPADALTGPITAAIAEVNPDVVLRFRPLTEVLGAAMLTERVVATLSGFFGVLALLLAMIGLYGVMSYAVARRRGEIGLRMALGAGPARVLRLVMTDVGIVTITGVIIGAGAGLAASRVISSLLYGLSPNDATTLVIAIGVLVSAAVLAGYLPARRAAQLDPMVALREE